MALPDSPTWQDSVVPGVAVSGLTAEAVSETSRTSFSTAQVSVGATPTLIAAARVGRDLVTVINHGTTLIFIGSASVTITTGFLLPANAAITIPTTAAIYGVVAAATQTVSVLESY